MVCLKSFIVVETFYFQASFTTFVCFSQDNYQEGHRWGKMALKILEKEKQRNPFIRTRIMLHLLLLWWGRPLRESSHEMFKVYKLGMQFGDVASASVALTYYLRWMLYAGEKLSSLQGQYDSYLKQVVKFNREAAKQSILDKVLIDLLVGVPCETFSIFDGMIVNEASLLADSLYRRNYQIISSVYVSRFFAEFWMGNYSEALPWSTMFLSCVKMSGPFMIKLLFTGCMGVASFQLYRDGKGEKHFNTGKEMLDELEKWSEHSADDVLKNKLLLLRAEHFASICEVSKAKDAYESSIRTARKYGRINEQALAYELQGNYLSSIVEIPEATASYRNAHELYTQWGALAIAKRIKENHSLDLVAGEMELNSTKHARDW